MLTFVPPLPKTPKQTLNPPISTHFFPKLGHLGPNFQADSNILGRMGEKCSFSSFRITKVTEIHPKLAKFGCSEAYGQRLSPWLNLGPNFGVKSHHFGQKWEKWVKNAHFCPSSPQNPETVPKSPKFDPFFPKIGTFGPKFSGRFQHFGKNG